MAKKIGIAVLVLLVLVGIALGVLWKRLTALPDWYESPDMIAEDGRPRVDRDWVQIPGGEPHAGGYVLRNPHLRSESPAPLQKAIKQSRATYDDGNLEAGGVLNLSDMDVNSLSAEEREQYQKSIDAFPALTGRDVYVGVEGAVDGGDGKLELGSDTKLKIGETSYSLSSAAKRLGMSEAELRAAIEKQLAGMDLQIPAE